MTFDDKESRQPMTLDLKSLIEAEIRRAVAAAIADAMSVPVPAPTPAPARPSPGMAVLTVPDPGVRGPRPRRLQKLRENVGHVHHGRALVRRLVNGNGGKHARVAVQCEQCQTVAHVTANAWRRFGCGVCVKRASPRRTDGVSKTAAIVLGRVAAAISPGTVAVGTSADFAQRAQGESRSVGSALAKCADRKVTVAGLVVDRIEDRPGNYRVWRMPIEAPK